MSLSKSHTKSSPTEPWMAQNRADTHAADEIPLLADTCPTGLRDHQELDGIDDHPRLADTSLFFPSTKSSSRAADRQARFLKMLFASIWIAFTLALGASTVSGISPRKPTTAPTFTKNQKLWAQYAPWFPAAQYRAPPSGCHITQVNILQRHGARFPTSGATTAIRSALSKLSSVQNFTDPRLDFLRTYQYTLGINDLVPFGALQSSQSGQEAFKRYSSIVKKDNVPFVRAASSERVVLTATNWTAGFSAASHHVFNPVLNVIISEDGNNTLEDSLCPNAGNSAVQTQQWAQVFATPIADRLNQGAPGANLTAVDIFNLISLCPFDSVAKETKGPFCDIFDDAAFQGFEYTGDLDKFYGTGYGQALGRVQGVGYVNELLARLTGKPVVDNTQTNRTLDSSPITFPLNRTIYADFSHDNQMIAIYSAIGLFRQPQPLNPTQPDERRTWVTAKLVPFSGRLVTEKLECGHGQARKEFVRMLMNDALQPLEFCNGGKRRDGLCELDAFVESQAYARNDGEGDFQKCFA
ncbi:hypothetical protein HGRIS_005794 [Hohenbuehelia grisea]|uniref:Phytase A n=1 Tax=Hohenbuehelia grisea TaxID=104357 RepID=A0ABR3JZT7_9AGAR